MKAILSRFWVGSLILFASAGSFAAEPSSNPSLESWISSRVEHYLNSTAFQKLVGSELPVRFQLLSYSKAGVTVSLDEHSFKILKVDDSYRISALDEAVPLDVWVRPITRFGLLPAGADVELITQDRDGRTITVQNRFGFPVSPSAIKDWISATLLSENFQNSTLSLRPSGFDGCNNPVCAAEQLPMAILMFILLIIFAPAILLACLLFGSATVGFC
jgi:hypothetical protein